MLEILSGWFYDRSVAGDYRRWHYIVLTVLVLLGVAVRFWGLDNVGLHGDEETMAMAAMGVIETGRPVLPSGMYYARAPIHTYLMAASASLFGISEWAWRLPSALVGCLTGIAAFLLGKRFLPPLWNLGLVASVVFFPHFVEISQTARMYVFFVTGLMFFGACIFRWENDERYSSLFLALIVWAVTLQFQRLTVFAAPLFLYPGFSRRSGSLLAKGVAALLASALIFGSYRHWVASNYPDDEERIYLDVAEKLSATDVLTMNPIWITVVALTAVFVLVMAYRICKGMEQEKWHAYASFGSVLAGLVAICWAHYHLAGLLMLAGLVVWSRADRVGKKWFLSILAVGIAVALYQLLYLYSSDLFPGRKVIGALIGKPSVWPMIRFTEFSIGASFLYGAVIVAVLYRWASRQAVPTHVLFFIISVWAPLLGIGLFRWYVPLRYLYGPLSFFLLCVFAGTLFLINLVIKKQAISQSGLVPLAVAVLIVNPFALAAVVNAGYERYPDHKGAAEFILRVDPNRESVLIAEDILQQTYYLGGVDYRLLSIVPARVHGVLRDSRLVDQYTGTPIITSGEELLKVLEQHARGDIYIIGSAENITEAGARERERGNGIQEVLQSDQLKVVYEGRDVKTKVWKFKGGQ